MPAEVVWTTISYRAAGLPTCRAFFVPTTARGGGRVTRRCVAMRPGRETSMATQRRVAMPPGNEEEGRYFFSSLYVDTALASSIGT